MGMDNIHGGDGWGDTLTPTDSLRWSEKFPPTGVGFCPARHPRLREGLLLGGGGPKKILPSVPFPQIHLKDPQEGLQQPYIQEYQYLAPKYIYVCLGELDGLMCCHSTPVCSSPRQDIVLDRGSRLASEGGVW